MRKKISRRDLLQILSNAAVFGLCACAWPRMAFSQDEKSGLKDFARAKNCLYGAAVQSRQLQDAAFIRALKKEAALLVPEGELKWATVHPKPNEYDFSGYHRLAAFAQENSMTMRGHTLLWHRSNPAWLEPALENKKVAEKILEDHIRRVMQETSPLIRNWDVVNEAVQPAADKADGLRPSLWWKVLGADYIPLAFQIAHDAQPGATLVYNDHSLEYGDGDGITRRKAVLKLLKKLKRENAPVHALGLQSHLLIGRPLGGDDFLSFLAELRGMDLKIYITELDLDFRLLGGPSAQNITTAQHYLRTYLDMVQDGGALEMLLTWGLSDRTSWLKHYEKNAEGALPLDAHLRHGAMWETLRKIWS